MHIWPLFVWETRLDFLGSLTPIKVSAGSSEETGDHNGLSFGLPAWILHDKGVGSETNTVDFLVTSKGETGFSCSILTVSLVSIWTIWLLSCLILFLRLWTQTSSFWASLIYIFKRLTSISMSAKRALWTVCLLLLNLIKLLDDGIVVNSIFSLVTS